MQSYAAGCLVSAAGDRVWVDALPANVLEFGCITTWESTAFLLYRMQWAGRGHLAGGGSMRLGSCLRSGWSKGIVVVGYVARAVVSMVSLNVADRAQS